MSNACRCRTFNTRKNKYIRLMLFHTSTLLHICIKTFTREDEPGGSATVRNLIPMMVDITRR